VRVSSAAKLRCLENVSFTHLTEQISTLAIGLMKCVILGHS